MKIKITLNPKSVSDAIKEITEYRDNLVRSKEEITRELTEAGVEIAKSIASEMNAYDSGVLVNGIHAEYRDGKGYVVSSAPYSAFVEFGTGIVGEMSPHPDAAAWGWTYDVNQHGDLGWWFRDSDGEWHWTAGMISRPFMYETARELNDMAGPVAKELLSRND